MTVSHRKDGLWQVQIPTKLSQSGKREWKYFPNKLQAEAWVRDFKNEQREHGKQSVTAEHRHWIGYLQEQQIATFEQLTTAIDHWKRTGQHLKPMSAADAVKTFIQTEEPNYPNRRTWGDITERLAKFAGYFGTKSLHEVTVTDIEDFLGTVSAGWNRWSTHKRVKAFYKFAHRHSWIATNLMDQVPQPRTEDPERLIYTPEQFQDMLFMCQNQYPELVPYVVLGGFCFLRTSELVRKYANEQVLQWSDINLDQGAHGEIHVRPGVAKANKRRSDDRYIELSETARAWLEPVRKETGDCVALTYTEFGKHWREMMDKAGVEPIDNGLRHSAISYSIAAHPEHGIQLTARWAGNSETTIRKHYLRWLTEKQGKAWFAVKDINTAAFEDPTQFGFERSDLGPPVTRHPDGSVVWPPNANVK
jgi:hypothetical protein